ncbi:hypothetical protein [Phenylobacterium sp.]|uniref:hypothetical protein n=1 Tax=Phenylobacterium sp. TaxID=1871053 RepID=UPI0039476AAE
MGERLSDLFWLVLHEPGCVPVRKGPWPMKQTAKVLREFMRARPAAIIDYVTMGPDGPDFEHGPTALQIADGRSMNFGRRHNKRVADEWRAALQPKDTENG